MLENYGKFLNELDRQLGGLFESQKAHIHCKPGCSGCCEVGDYPMSRLEMEYLMSAFVRLDAATQAQVRANIDATRGATEYQCPFLIGGLCSVYEHRGIVCRTHGLAYLCEEGVKLPECVREGLNYSEVFDVETSIFSTEPIKTSLRTDDILRSPLAKHFQLEPGDIRPLIAWFS